MSQGTEGGTGGLTWTRAFEEAEGFQTEEGRVTFAAGQGLLEKLQLPEGRRRGVPVPWTR